MCSLQHCLFHGIFGPNLCSEHTRRRAAPGNQDGGVVVGMVVVVQDVLALLPNAEVL